MHGVNTRVRTQAVVIQVNTIIDRINITFKTGRCAPTGSALNPSFCSSCFAQLVRIQHYTVGTVVKRHVIIDIRNTIAINIGV